jgi:uncharacterized protein YqjF (DUF2071 family)
MISFRHIPLEDYLTKSRQPWLLFMTWLDLFFASWRVPVEAARSVLPRGLELDTFDGTAWVTMVPMRVTGMHWRGIPPIPGMDGFRELNLRTYVRQNGKPGVCFLSIECPAGLSDWIARQFFGVPYHFAQMITFNDSDFFHYASERLLKDRTSATFFAKFRALEGGHQPVPNTIEHFLLERYASYFVHQGKTYRGEIQHEKWNVQPAEAFIEVNTIADAAGLQLSARPDHVAFVARTDTLIFPPVVDDVPAVAAREAL